MGHSIAPPTFINHFIKSFSLPCFESVALVALGSEGAAMGLDSAADSSSSSSISSKPR